MLNILIVGCGNIGKRHLFSIYNNSNNYEIQVLEKNKKKIDISKKIVLGFDNYIDNFSKINRDTKLILICTKAYKREKIIKNILKYCSPKYMIIEKIPFQSMTHYDDIMKLLKHRKIKTWINFPFRYQKWYGFLRKIIFKKNKFFTMIVLMSRSDDLFSTGIHFFELFLFKAEKDLKIEHIKVKKINTDLNGKYRGEFVFSSKNRTLAVMNSKTQFQQKLYIFGSNNNFKVKFFSDKKNPWKNPKVTFYKDDKKLIDFNHLWQSEITHLYINDIQKTGKCSLPTIRESYKCNELLLDSFKKKLKKFLKNSLCPIT